jgi:hypothetical protein
LIFAPFQSGGGGYTGQASFGVMVKMLGKQAKPAIQRRYRLSLHKIPRLFALPSLPQGKYLMGLGRAGLRGPEVRLLFFPRRRRDG